MNSGLRSLLKRSSLGWKRIQDDEAIQIPQEEGKCQLGSNKGEELLLFFFPAELTRDVKKS